MQYNGEHSVTFINGKGESKNSWKDFLLVPVNRPVVVPPEAQDFTEEIPARNGKLDFQDYILTGTVFKNREGTIEFLIDHENDKYVRWTVIKNEVMKFIHGQYLKMVLEDEPDYFYEGRFFIDEWKNNSDWSTFSVKYDVYPYKESIIATTDAWKWDPFNFINGKIHDVSNYVYKTEGQNSVNITLSDINYPTRVKLMIESTTSLGQVVVEIQRFIHSGTFITERVFLSPKKGTYEFTMYPDFPYAVVAVKGMEGEAYQNTIYVVTNWHDI